MKRPGLVLPPPSSTLPALAVALATLTLAAAGRAESLPTAADLVVDYDLAVELLPETHELVGSGRVVWRNPADEVVPDLWFHLYLNAFRNNESTFYRESGGRLRRDTMPEDGWGGIEIEHLALADGSDLLPGLTFESPDDGNPEDRTVARVVLPAPVPAGGEVTFDVGFRARLPKVFARTGYFRDFHLVGQWFPKLAVYEPAGQRGRETGGWNCHQFHANSEFYANYARYRVAITVPERFVVGATGEWISTVAAGDGRVTHVHAQDQVHDFAWTADPRYLEITDRFVAADEVSAERLAATAERLGRSVADVRLSDVAIRLLLQPEHRAAAPRYLAAAKVALRELGLAYGRYPYPTLTVVDPPAAAPGARGMEYPTFVTGGSSQRLLAWPFAGLRAVEAVTMHEIAHQWWYGLAGSNEFEEPWLDEGFTSYATGKGLLAGWGELGVVELFGWRLPLGDFDRLQNHHQRRFDQVRTAAWGFSREQYGFNSYARPALVLRSLEGLLGADTMARVLRTYAERWRFRHPRSNDFYAVATEVSGRDLSSFFAQVVESPGVFDPAVTALASAPTPAPRGRFERDGAVVDISEAAAEQEEARRAELGQRSWRSRIELRHLGEVILPVEVALRYADDRRERRTWAGERRWARWEVDDAQPVVAVTLDPDGRIPLDASRLNNHRRTSVDRRSTAFLTARSLFWLQQLLVLAGG